MAITYTEKKIGQFDSLNESSFVSPGDSA